MKLIRDEQIRAALEVWHTEFESYQLVAQAQLASCEKEFGKAMDDTAAYYAGAIEQIKREAKLEGIKEFWRLITPYMSSDHLGEHLTFRIRLKDWQAYLKKQGLEGK